MTVDPGLAYSMAINAAVARLSGARRKKSYEASNGERVEGWQIQTLPSKEYRDGMDLYISYPEMILTEAGELWSYSETTKELQETPWTFSKEYYLSPQPRQLMVGSKGKPFSEIISTLDRSGW